MNEHYKHTLGLKVEPLTVDSKTLYCIKKATGLSLADIKNKISNNDYLLQVDACEIEELQKINRLKRELDNLKVKVALYKDDERKSSEYFDNIENRLIEIAEESD